MKEKAFTAIAVLAVAGVLLLAQVRRDNRAVPASATGTSRTSPAPPRSPPVVFYPPGQRPEAPGFDLQVMGDGRLDLDSLRGKVVMINFWATWCKPCIDELPSLDALSSRLQGTGFVLVAVNVDEDATAAARLLSRLADLPGGKVPSFKVALDPGGKVAAEYGTKKFPETYLVGPKGRMLAKFIGPRDWTRPMYERLVRMILSSGTSASIPHMGASGR